MTFGRRFSDYPVATERRYPGVDGHVHYDEGVFVGYRGFDRADTDPLFPFGHGGSYAAFAYRKPAVERTAAGLAVSVVVENVAARRGRDVVQVYVAPPDDTVARPEQELGGFASITLDAGEQRRVDMSVPQRAFARYDPSAGWTVDPGEYTVIVGRSSRDRRVTERIDLDCADAG